MSSKNKRNDSQKFERLETATLDFSKLSHVKIEQLSDTELNSEFDYEDIDNSPQANGTTGTGSGGGGGANRRTKPNAQKRLSVMWFGRPCAYTCINSSQHNKHLHDAGKSYPPSLGKESQTS